MLRNDTLDAKRAIIRLDDEVQRHYETDSKSISYFAGQLNPTQRIFVTDYLKDVLSTITKSLETMDSCLSQYKIKRYNQELRLKARMNLNKREIFIDYMGEQEEELNFYKGLLEEQFFMKFGGAIDLLASVLVVCSGVGMDVRSVSYHMLKPGGSMETQASKSANKLGFATEGEVKESQLSLLRSLHSTVAAGDDSDWFPWFLDRRNQIVHRAQGVSVSLFTKGGMPGQFGIAELTTRYPQEGLLSATKKARGFKESFVPQDIQEIMLESHARFCHIVTAVMDACTAFCERRGRGDLRVEQQANQWSSEDKANYEFNGFKQDKKIVKALEVSNQVMANGSLLERVSGLPVVLGDAATRAK